MSDNTTPAEPIDGEIMQQDAMRPDEVPSHLVELMQSAAPALRAVPPWVIAAGLAKVLPEYGALVQQNAATHDYHRREDQATALTTRVYGASLLSRLAFEAETDARRGVDPALNAAVAERLRDGARREGRP